MVAAALIAAVTNAPISAYVAYTNHMEEMARISGEYDKRTSDGMIASRTKVLDTSQARCSAALQFLGDERINPLLEPVETQALLADMRQIVSTSCGSTLPDLSGVANSRPQDVKDVRR